MTRFVFPIVAAVAIAGFAAPSFAQQGRRYNGDINREFGVQSLAPQDQSVRKADPQALPGDTRVAPAPQVASPDPQSIYDRGYNDGYGDGKDAGYQDGKTVGYNTGYNDGRASTPVVVNSYPPPVVYAPAPVVYTQPCYRPSPVVIVPRVIIGIGGGYGGGWGHGHGWDRGGYGHGGWNSGVRFSVSARF